MAHKCLVGGTAYEVQGGRALVGGTGYSVKKGRALVGGTGYDVEFGFEILENFADNDWATIIYACQNGLVPDTWAVGDSKGMDVDGIEYQVDIIGRDHDTYADGNGTAPLTFQFHDCYHINYEMNNSDEDYSDWDNCDMRNYYLPEFFDLLPSEVQAAIKSVEKKHSNFSVYTEVISLSSGYDGLFLLAEVEVYRKTFFGSAISIANEGTQYEYYSADSTRRVKCVPNGTAVGWWTRSLESNGIGQTYCYFDASGTAVCAAAWTPFYIAPAFCF